MPTSRKKRPLRSIPPDEILVAADWCKERGLIGTALPDPARPWGCVVYGMFVQEEDRPEYAVLDAHRQALAAALPFRELVAPFRYGLRADYFFDLAELDAVLNRLGVFLSCRSVRRGPGRERWREPEERCRVRPHEQD